MERFALDSPGVQRRQNSVGKVARKVRLRVGASAVPTEVATTIAYVGAFAGLVGGGVALFNSYKAVSWKRAELANTYLKDFNNNPELVFAVRCLDWNGGRLLVPDSLCGYLENGVNSIYHDRDIFALSLRPSLKIGEIDKDPRGQIYRISMDSFLTWLSLVSSALDRKLFSPQDLEDVGYWVSKIQTQTSIHPFISHYGYGSSINNLIRKYRKKQNRYKKWLFPVDIITSSSNDDSEIVS